MFAKYTLIGKKWYKFTTTKNIKKAIRELLHFLKAGKANIFSDSKKLRKVNPKMESISRGTRDLRKRKR